MFTRSEREAFETADTLLEDRGPVNARAWVKHCMVRDPSGGFWRRVLDAIDWRLAHIAGIHPLMRSDQERAWLRELSQ